MIHSQMVAPPLAAIEGTTFRLKTATTKSNTRSRRPRARIKRGWVAGWVVVDNACGPRRSASLCSADSRGGCLYASLAGAGRAGEAPAPHTNLVRYPGGDSFGALLLRFRQGRGY